MATGLFEDALVEFAVVRPSGSRFGSRFVPWSTELRIWALIQLRSELFGAHQVTFKVYKAESIDVVWEIAVPSAKMSRKSGIELELECSGKMTLLEYGKYKIGTFIIHPSGLEGIPISWWDFEIYPEE